MGTTTVRTWQHLQWNVSLPISCGYAHWQWKCFACWSELPGFMLNWGRRREASTPWSHWKRMLVSCSMARLWWRKCPSNTTTGQCQILTHFCQLGQSAIANLSVSHSMPVNVSKISCSLIAKPWETQCQSASKVMLLSVSQSFNGKLTVTQCQSVSVSTKLTVSQWQSVAVC